LGDTWFSPKNRIALHYGSKFPVALTRHVNLSHLTDSYAICCMLPVLHVLPPTLI